VSRVGCTRSSEVVVTIRLPPPLLLSTKAKLKMALRQERAVVTTRDGSSGRNGSVIGREGPWQPCSYRSVNNAAT